MRLVLRKPEIFPGKTIYVCLLISIGLFISMALINTLAHSSNENVSAASPSQLIVYDPKDDLPKEILENFQQEFQVELIVIHELQPQPEISGIDEHPFDIAIINNNQIPRLVANGKLAELHLNNIPNFKYIFPDFRDLAYDPGNHHSIPFNWGTTGLITRKDLIDSPPEHWIDLWDDRYRQQIIIRTDDSLDLISLTLKSLGYSINTNRQSVFDHAYRRLEELKPNLIFVNSQEEANDLMINGKASILLGHAEDVSYLEAGQDIFEYSVPKEGTVFWGDNLVISANCKNIENAENLINYLLRPDISAKLANEKQIATPNALAVAQIEDRVLNNPAVFPKNVDLIDSEVLLPQNTDTYTMYINLWENFISNH